ncbi:MAG TPA: hypothetical protein VMX16_09845 [Terriglobia bacterium]|nr:hypothetical protein [Terriglobia bacterium]
MTNSVLDCGSFHSAVESSAALLGITGKELLNRLNAFDGESLSTAARHNHPYEDLLIRKTFRVEPSELPAPPVIYWFHATRVPPDTRFQDGIQPLSQILGRVWAFLGSLASGWSTPTEWLAFKNGMRGQFADQYARKVTSGFNEGPFAFLVREVVLLRDRVGANHDFLGIPELVEDICLSYEGMFGHCLRARFSAATRPCIVKFRSTDPGRNALAAALMYVHRKAKGQELDLSCNTCYSGEGRAVPPHGILQVEWPEFEA